jgi:hypothetical protein
MTIFNDRFDSFPAMTEPATIHHLWRPDDPPEPGIKASMISLVCSEELDGIISSMRQLEASWNSKFNYPWIFFNNVPFTEEFKRIVSTARSPDSTSRSWSFKWGTPNEKG